MFLNNKEEEKISIWCFFHQVTLFLRVLSPLSPPPPEVTWSHGVSHDMRGNHPPSDTAGHLPLATLREGNESERGTDFNTKARVSLFSFSGDEFIDEATNIQRKMAFEMFFFNVHQTTENTHYFMGFKQQYKNIFQFHL